MYNGVPDTGRCKLRKQITVEAVHGYTTSLIPLFIAFVAAEWTVTIITKWFDNIKENQLNNRNRN